MIYCFKCLVCEKEVQTYRSPNAPEPRFCSKLCYRKYSPHWLFRVKYSDLSEDDKKKRLKEYFENHVIRTRGCWDWKTKGEANGYIRMQFSHDQSKILAHRYSYLIHNGPIPDGMIVCHKCDNRRCTNPKHLFLGTYADNIRDMVKNNRHIRGEASKQAKIITNQVKEIKKLLKLGLSATKISELLKISVHTIYHIKHGTTWKHLK